MKILNIITRLNVGVPAIQALDLTKELGKRGHEVMLISGSGEKYEGCILDYPTKRKGVINVCLKSSLKRELNLRNDINAFRFLRWKIKAEKPDVIHTRMSKAGALIRLVALTKEGVKVI